MTTKLKITTIRSDGVAEVGWAGVVMDDDVQRSMEEVHNRLSREARLNANITSIEETVNSLVVVFNHGRVEVRQWIKGGENDDHDREHLGDRDL